MQICLDGTPEEMAALVLKLRARPCMDLLGGVAQGVTEAVNAAKGAEEAKEKARGWRIPGELR